MVKPGQINQLVIVEKTPFGAYLNAGEQQLVFANNSLLPNEADVGDTVSVFIYQDSEGEYKTTDNQAMARVGEFARLTVVEVNNVGAFLDWGLPKDLLVPYAEQSKPLKEGQSPVVYIYQNKADGRVVASTKIEKFLDKTSHSFSVGDRVDLVITDKTDLGIKAIIDHQYLGMIHNDDLHKKVKYGQKLTGYIKNIRDDQKLDITLQKPGLAGRDALAEKILAEINKNDGVLAISDKSSPDIIAKVFGVSKKQYKTALGKLYKEKVIVIDDNLVKKVSD